MVARFLAALLIGVIVSKWILVRVALTNPPWSLVGFMSLMLVALLILTVTGLIRVREWGFIAAYVLVPFSTVFHGVALVPWVTEALPTLRLRTWAVLILNALFLTAAIWAHWKYRRSGQGRESSWRVGGR